jgi:hypothetical protein
LLAALKLSTEEKATILGEFARGHRVGSDICEDKTQLHETIIKNSSMLV